MQHHVQNGAISRLSRLFALFFAATASLSFSQTRSLAQIGVPNLWGHNSAGTIGDGTTIQRNSPVSIASLARVIQISAGYKHTLALTATGRVYAWGGNVYGNLGDGTTTNRIVPTLIPSLTNVVQVLAGDSCSFALKSDGTVWGWGWNYYGQLGDGTNRDRLVPTMSPSLSGVVQISTNQGTTLALKSDGTVYAWGFNYYGQVGDGTTTNRLSPALIAGLDHVTQVSMGAYHALALKSDGSVWSWGRNNAGQLGDGTTANRLIPVAIASISNATQISAGQEHSMTMHGDGVVMAWGQNYDGRLGDGTTASRLSPVPISGIVNPVQIVAGYANSMALQSDGTVMTWGPNFNGILGDGTTVSRITPGAVPGLTNQTSISMMAFHAASLQAERQATLLTTPSFTIHYAEAFNMKAFLRVARSGAPLIGKPISYFIDGSLQATATTDAAGRIAVRNTTSSSFLVGAHPVVAKFYGDGGFIESGQTATITVEKADTRLRMSNDSGTVFARRNIAATLRRLTDGAALAFKEVSFYLEGSLIGTAITDGTGRATLPYMVNNSFGYGPKTLIAKFYGDDNHNRSDATATFTINKAPTRLRLYTATGRAGGNIALRARLSRASDGALLPGATLRFEVDGAAVGSATTDGAGLATLLYTIPAGAAGGVHTVAVYFDGDPDYLSSTISGGTLTVTP